MVGMHYYKSVPSSLPKYALSKITRQRIVLDYLHWIGNWDPVFSSIFPPTVFLIFLTGEGKVLWWRFQGGGRVICILTWSEVKWKSLSCVRLFVSIDYTVHGILQARILKWVAFPFSRRSSQPRDWTQVSCTAGRCLTSWATKEARSTWSSGSHILVGKKVCIRVDCLNLVTKSKTQREHACQDMRLKRMEKS